jgi:hypothetical protein
MYPNRRGRERRWAVLALMLLAPSAWAHDADVIYVMLNEAPGGALEEVVTLTAGTLSQLAPIDADKDGTLSQTDLDARGAAIVAGVWEQMPLESATPCARSGEQAVLREGYVELFAKFTCPEGPLSQDFRILRGLTTNYRVVLGRQVEGETGRAFAQGNVQRLVIRPEPAEPARAPLGFGAGVLSALIWLDVTLVWLLALLLAMNVREAFERWAVLALVHGAVSLAASVVALRIPELAGAALVAVIGGAFALQVLGRESARAPLLTLGLLAVAASLRESTGGTIGFEAGRGAGLLLLAVIAVPILRLIARRPALKAKATVALACASLAALGFSLVQSVRTF